jgi:hypothetical protein
MWRDGMGRLTIKTDTGTAQPFDFITAGGIKGIVRRPGWLIIYGQSSIRVTGVDRSDYRARLAERARYRRAQRHGPRALRNHGYGPAVDDPDADCYF